MSGEVELKLGRAQDVLPSSARRFNALFCDPPRAIRPNKQVSTYVNLVELRDILDACWDLLLPDAWVAMWVTPEGRYDLSRFLREDVGLFWKGEVVWNQMSHRPVTRGIAYQHEYVLLYGRTTDQPQSDWPLLSVWNETLPFFAHRHPQAKPVSVCRKVLEWITPQDGAQVLDPCAGEGPIMLAAIESGRGYLGAEVEQQWATNAMTAGLRARR
jgi:hypothetical protein